MTQSILAMVLLAGMALGIVTFQNCAPKTGQADMNSQGIDITCLPQGQPCLKYVVTTFSHSHQGSGFNHLIVNGRASVDGLLNATQFSSNCRAESSISACCSMGQVTATFTTQANPNKSITLSFFNSPTVDIDVATKMIRKPGGDPSDGSFFCACDAPNPTEECQMLCAANRH